jgi:hypothetical protein
MGSKSDEAVFVITRDGDVEVFDSIEIAEGNLEAIDVLDGEYVELFGIDGERLTISASQQDFKVVIERTGRFELGTLVDRLNALAERNGFDGSRGDPRAIANQVLINEWRVRWPRWPHWLDRRIHGDGPPQV